MSLFRKQTLLIIFIFSSYLTHGSYAQQKKNLLVIMTDQQRYDALSIAGNTTIKTPNLDSLAKQGAYFTNAYTPCAVCGPARSSILTGARVEATGVISNEQTYYYSDSEVMTMPTFDEILAENGYHCEYYGKWHALSACAEIYQNPVAKASGDKSVFGPGGQAFIWRDYLATLGTIPGPASGQFIDGMSRYPYVANPLDRYYGMSWEELQSNGLKHSQPDQHGELLLDKQHTMTAFQARQTIKAIERLKDKTFSITCSFHFPHAPMTVPEPYYSMYPVDEMPLPASLNDPMENSPYANANGRTKRTEYADPDKIRYMIAEYYGIITEIDDWVGKILDKLEELGIAEKTMIVFMSDHGEMLGAHGMREKNIFLEESAHIPLFISAPGDIQEETAVDGYVSLIDVFPTILDYLNMPQTESDGKSLRGLIEGTDNEHGNYVVTEWDMDNTSNYMIVKDGFKLIIPYTIQSNVINAMYDLNSDPYEMTNLLGNNPNRSAYIEKAEDLRNSLLEWLAAKQSIHYNSVSQRDLLNGGRPTGNNAEVVSFDLPEAGEGETVNVNIVMRNTGTSSWSKAANTQLHMCSGNEGLYNFKQVEIAEGEQVLPGGIKAFSFEITMPETDGVYTMQWQMKQVGEEWFGQKTEAIQLVLGQPLSYLDDCDELIDWRSSQSLVLDTESQKQGSGCINFSGSTTDEFKKVFAEPFVSEAVPANGLLEFWYYISDPSMLGTIKQVELGSAGKPDVDEYNWPLPELSEGWNFISLDISNANKLGAPDLKAINWFRLYSKKTGSVESKIDAIWLGNKNITGLGVIKSGLEKANVRVVPNPVMNDSLNLILNGFSEGSQLDIRIYDMDGRPVSMKKSIHKSRLVLHLPDLKDNAVYMIRVSSNKVYASSKFLTQ